MCRAAGRHRAYFRPRWAFAYGSQRGVLALPFYISSLLLALSALLAATVPAAQWSSDAETSPRAETAAAAARKDTRPRGGAAAAA